MLGMLRDSDLIDLTHKHVGFSFSPVMSLTVILYPFHNLNALVIVQVSYKSYSIMAPMSWGVKIISLFFTSSLFIFYPLSSHSHQDKYKTDLFQDLMGLHCTQ